MRAVLFAGARLCCIIGVFFVSRFAYEVLKIWPDIPHDPKALFIAVSYYWALIIYMMLAFAPVIMILQSRPVKKAVWRFVIVGATELIVIAAFLAMLLTMLI